tara:strand:+ start:9888 stop:10685 length:798 start_codon:yes stop_codon:yes gene_type:complete
MAQREILITGGNGYIAKSISQGLWKYSDRDNITSISRKDFDLTNKKSTNKWFEGKYFDVIIHTAVVGGSRLTPDTSETFYQNLQMFYNLYYNKHCFSKFIHFGSGAELGTPTDPYGLSKKIINKLIQSEPNFYNIRIFGVFNEHELNTRFIKSNIKRYINKQPIEIYQDKLMDFFYMEDLVTLVKYCIHDMCPPKNINCSYKKSYSLLNIANIINNLSDYKVGINILERGEGTPYIDKHHNALFNYKGLELGIKETYKKILNGKN